MKLIHDGLPMEGEESDDCSVTFEFEGYVYYIGQIEGPPGWFSRQTVDDYENGRDNWEKPSGWVDERRKPDFKFLKIEKL
jgi:hypothetical protein